jgi:type IV pilus assembly protein PilC
MSRIPLKRLADLCHRVGISYRSGIDLRTIWQRESESGSRSHRVALGIVRDKVGAGETVAQGMRATRGYFPELACAIAEAGETGGRLEQSFRLLGKHYDTIVRFWRDMVGRLAWPVFQLVAAFIVIAVTILIMGWVTGMNPEAEQPDWLGFGWTTTQYFWAWVTLAIVLFGGSFVVIYGSLTGWFGDYPMRLARRVPLIGKTIQVLSLARFAWVLAAVYEAGMNTMHGVALAFRATHNHYYQQFEQPTVDRLQDGMELADALRLTNAFPTDFLMYVENGELTGELPESMNRLAEQYTDEAEKNLAIISKIMFFVIFGFIAVVIAAMIISLYANYINTIRSYM